MCSQAVHTSTLSVMLTPRSGPPPYLPPIRPSVCQPFLCAWYTTCTWCVVPNIQSLCVFAVFSWVCVRACVGGWGGVVRQTVQDLPGRRGRRAVTPGAVQVHSQHRQVPVPRVGRAPDARWHAPRDHRQQAGEPVRTCTHTHTHTYTHVHTDRMVAHTQLL